MKKKVSFRTIIETCSDRCKFALVSTGYILRRPKYLIVALVTLLVFLFLLTFFRDGDGNWQLLCSGLPFDRKLDVLARVFAGIFSNFTSLYGVCIVFLSLLQALVVMHLVFSWRHREKSAAIDGASAGGIGAVLGFVALGCPSCGIGLLTPILSAVAGASATMLAESIGVIFTVIAFALLFFTVIRLGYINYIIIGSKNYKEEYAKSH